MSNILFLAIWEGSFFNATTIVSLGKEIFSNVGWRINWLGEGIDNFIIFVVCLFLWS
jgi:hypothetical protein